MDDIELNFKDKIILPVVVKHVTRDDIDEKTNITLTVKKFIQAEDEDGKTRSVCANLQVNTVTDLLMEQLNGDLGVKKLVKKTPLVMIIGIPEGSLLDHWNEAMDSSKPIKDEDKDQTKLDPA